MAKDPNSLVATRRKPFNLLKACAHLRGPPGPVPAKLPSPWRAEQIRDIRVGVALDVNALSAIGPQTHRHEPN